MLAISYFVSCIYSSVRILSNPVCYNFEVYRNEKRDIFQWNSILSELQKLLVVLLFFIHIYYIWREIMVCSSKYFLLYQLLNFCSILCPWFWYIFNSLLYNQLISNLIHANRLGRLVQYMKIGVNYWFGKISLNLFVLGSVFALPWLPIFFFFKLFSDTEKLLVGKFTVQYKWSNC